VSEGQSWPTLLHVSILVGQKTGVSARVLIHNRDKKPEAPPRHSFDELWVAATVAESAAQAIHQHVQTVLQILVTAGPQRLLDLITADYFARSLSEQTEKFQCLPGEPDRFALPREAPADRIELELAESHRLART